jgi:hypothetical protein
VGCIHSRCGDGKPCAVKGRGGFPQGHVSTTASAKKDYFILSIKEKCLLREKNPVGAAGKVKTRKYS